MFIGWFRDAIEVMQSKDLNQCPVIERGLVVGLLTRERILALRHSPLELARLTW